MILTRQHFVMIAEILAEQELSRHQAITLAAAFADRLAQHNTRVDRERFLAAALEASA